MVTPAVRREAVAQVRVTFEVSERRACSALGVDRTSVRYHSTRPDDAPLRAQLRELAVQRRRFGYTAQRKLPQYAQDQCCCLRVLYKRADGSERWKIMHQPKN